METVEEALAYYIKARDSLQPCSNGDCVVKRPIGMHTNSSCKCYKDPIKAQRMMYAGQRLADAIIAANSQSE